MNAPFQGFPPELLAKIAQGAFRPPGAMGGMQTPGFQMPTGGGGMGMGDGMAGLAQGLAGWKPGPAGDGTRTGNDADLGGYNNVKPGGMVDVGGGQMLPNPNGMQYGADGMQIGPAQGGGNFWQRNFGSLF